MARDKTAREHETESSLLDRRSYLKMAGAAAASVGAVGAVSGSADAASYDTIKVPAGSTRTFNLGSGDTLENKLIDITASGAQYRIRASGSGWTIRNVGVKGHFDSSNKHSPFIVQTPSGGQGTIENVYLGDGGGGGTTGLFIYVDHAGHIDVDRLNVQGWPDNGLYGSAPGNSSSHSAPGGGGTVSVTNSYGANNRVASFRLGTTGSSCQNCVAVGGTRGFWGYYETVEFNDCHSSNAGEQFRSGASAWSKGRQATIKLNNCKASGNLNSGPGSIQGSPGSDPRTSPPSGVPTSAEEAASGNATQSNDSTTQQPTTDEQTDESADEQAGTVLELVAGSNASNAPYEFTVEGSAEKRTSGSNNVAEGNDTITDNGDGTVTVSGVSGNGYGDAFNVNGVITSMNLDESQWTLRYDGQEVAADDIAFPKKLVIDGSNRPRVASTYTFEVSGTAVKSDALGTVNKYDTVENGTISGRTIGGKDGFRFSGQITGFSMDGPANVSVQDDS